MSVALLRDPVVGGSIEAHLLSLDTQVVRTQSLYVAGQPVPGPALETGSLQALAASLAAANARIAALEAALARALDFLDVVNESIAFEGFTWTRPAAPASPA